MAGRDSSLAARLWSRIAGPISARINAGEDESAHDAGAEADHEEAAAAERLAASVRLLAGETDPGLQAFFETLYGTAPPEDVTRYSPEALVILARRVYAATARRAPGMPLIAHFAPNDIDPQFGRNETILVAVNDDMPFLFDSTVAEITAQGPRVRAAFHPIIAVARDVDGLRPTGKPGGEAEKRESVIVLALDHIADETRVAALVAGLENVFGKVRVSVRDWRAMLARLREAVEGLKSHPPQISEEELDESIAFLDWLDDDHFTFLGSRDYAFVEGGEGRLEPVYESGLGLLADVDARVIRRGSDRATLTPEVRAFLTQPSPIIITKSNVRSVVHRRVHMDYVGVKTFDARGRLTGERRFVGLFTSGAYSRLPTQIPLLRRKVAHVLERTDLPRDSHDRKALAHILDTFPRDELFQIGEDDLFHTAVGILNLADRPKIRVFLRFDRFDRFVSTLVFVPRDRYNTAAREKIHAILARAFDGRMSAAYPSLGESPLARIHFIVGRNPGARPHVDPKAIEAEIRAAIRTWEDSFSDAVQSAHGEGEGQRLFACYGDAFPAGYRDAFMPADALADIAEIEAVLAGSAKGGTMSAVAYRRSDDARGVLRLKLFVQGGVISLSSCLPVFENLGLKVISEDSYDIAPRDAGGATLSVALQDFLMERADGGTTDLGHIKAPLEEAYHAVCAGRAENDGFNRLVTAAELSWRDVTILRAAAKYLRQAGIAFGQDYVELALAANSDIARLLVDLFYARNDPATGHDHEGRAARALAIHEKIDVALGDVHSLDDDRIIRRLRNVIDSTLRTDFFQADESGRPKPHIAFKLDSEHLDELPAPRPHVEIFVYAPQVEGVHLRFGKVARGGIRWSDRRDDFRTEVLGLVKAQQVKNAVIVPVGAKGGFYPKRLPQNATREDVQGEAISAYRTFIGALLDVTDNIGPDGTVIPPRDVVRHDGDDPYLVVAADKGTASFSDIANAIATTRGFWLGDAFASGGSKGYDHKKMGITARGAWEAVKRHFREMGRDIQSEPFTVVGVGDMSGDVFGNGMLLSRATKLVAAFDHRHVFVDPDPDPATSWAERRRLFDLPRSSWADYDKARISKGGGVFARSAKEIALTPEMKAIAQLDKDKVTPAELVKALLQIDVDLLWFGGIGTFVKASTQSHADVGDRANDVVRVNGRDIRAKVVGEGANLGATQLGRVEFARKGGRINTDAIDNSAGVDTSDHEVNLKVLMSGPLRRGELSEEGRDRLLEAMTEDVARHVLADNYEQTLALSIAQVTAPRDLGAHGRFMRDLERKVRLDRAVEALPDDETLARLAREEKGLARPELAVLLAYAKLELFAELAASDLIDDPYFEALLRGYFPEQAVSRFASELTQHRLKREIAATVLSNTLVNIAGPLFVFRMGEMSGAAAPQVARAFTLACGAFGLEEIRARVDALDLKIPADMQITMYADIAELLRRLGQWFLVNVAPLESITETVRAYAGGVAALKGTFSNLVSPFEARATEARIEELKAAGVPHDLAEDVAVLPLLGAAPEIVLLASTRNVSIGVVAGAYFAMGALLGLDRLRGLAARIAADGHWDRLAIRRTIDDLYASQRVLAGEAIVRAGRAEGTAGRAEGAAAVRAWAEARTDDVHRTRGFLHEIERDGQLSIAKLTLAASQIQKLSAV